MIKLPSKIKRNTIPDPSFELCPESEPANDTVFDRKKNNTNDNEDNYPEAEVIEVPVFRKMLFQFNKPVKLEFS